MTAPTSVLREAAAKLRTLVWTATDGPWLRQFPDGPNTGIVDDKGTTVVPGVAARWTWPRAADADYIVAMNPIVASALADLLDHIADDVDDDGGHEVTGKRGAVVDNYGSLRSDWTAALALARTILGSTS